MIQRANVAAVMSNAHAHVEQCHKPPLTQCIRCMPTRFTRDEIHYPPPPYHATVTQLINTTPVNTNKKKKQRPTYVTTTPTDAHESCTALRDLRFNPCPVRDARLILWQTPVTKLPPLHE